MRPVNTSIDCEYLQRDQPVVYVMCSLAGLATLSFVVALVLLVRLRHAPAVRLGQPLFLCVMAVGGMVALVPIFLIPGEPGNANCFAPTVVAMFGFSLTFGCLLLKTYRIYRIWEAAKLLKRIALTRRDMAWRLCLLLFVDAVVLVAWGLNCCTPACDGRARRGFGRGARGHEDVHEWHGEQLLPSRFVPVQDCLDAGDVLHGLSHA